MKPSVGRIVHYVSHGTPIQADGTQAFAAQCRAAVVSEVDPEDPARIGLVALNPTGMFFRALSARRHLALARAGRVIVGVTTDPTDPRLTHGPDPADSGYHEQAGTYLVLSPEERAKGFVRPVRLSYWHTTCGKITHMAQVIAETYARDPAFYGGTYCAHCGQHRPVGEHGEFYWCDTDNPERQAPASQPKVGT